MFAINKLSSFFTFLLFRNNTQDENRVQNYSKATKLAAISLCMFGEPQGSVAGRKRHQENVANKFPT